MLSLCPIDTRCVEVKMLDERERQWLNDYHLAVRNRLSVAAQCDQGCLTESVGCPLPFIGDRNQFT
jgi:Xaa-Pro aminopeptidase